MLKAITMTAILVVACTSAFSQTSRQRIRRNTENQLIAATRDFVRSSFSEVTVKESLALTLSGPEQRADIIAKRSVVDIAAAKVKVVGNDAIVVGRVVFENDQPQSSTTQNTNDVIVRFRKLRSGWKFVSGCFGKCDQQGDR
jgi:hypothetical protein